MVNGDNGLTVKISGQDILDLKEKVNSTEAKIDKGFAKIMEKLESGKDKIKLNRKMIFASFGLSMLIIGWIFMIVT